ncbi:hypothetical protein [Reinekea blandensis]|uniref:DNA repair ATPase n=1 Tax=Reinekea blandensis MED297 TaxID=314283 RepID=A4BDL9_9GAMM|nr:hypothetical protein [Reinekea blandensis]EAR09628.1 hypothetical protein MED297_15754 [Reinekea blandensis MED297]
MSFWAFIAVLVIMGIMFGGLYLSKIASNREQEIMERRRAVRNLRTDLIDIDELIGTLQLYDKNPELLDTMVNQMKSILHRGLQLLPDDESLKQDMDGIEARRQMIQKLQEEPEEPEVPESDRQIYLIKKHFGRTIKMLRQLQSAGDLNELDMSQHQTRLTRQSLMLEVKAYEQHGRNAKKQGDISSAANFFKHAKDLIMHTDLKFDGKTEEIKKISREISNLYVTLPEDEDPTSG